MYNYLHYGVGGSLIMSPTQLWYLVLNQSPVDKPDCHLMRVAYMTKLIWPNHDLWVWLNKHEQKSEDDQMFDIP